MRTASIKDLPRNSDFRRTEKNLVLNVFYIAAAPRSGLFACRLPLPGDVHAQMLHRFACTVVGFHNPGDGSCAPDITETVGSSVEHELSDPGSPDLRIDIGARQSAYGWIGWVIETSHNDANDLATALDNCRFPSQRRIRP